MRRVLIIVGIVLIPLIPVVLVVTGVIKRTPTTVSRVTLTVWVTNDQDRAALNTQVTNFRETHPYATIKVELVRSENYSTRLLEAWAQGKGPDIFFVPSTWTGAMEPYATAMPTDLTIPVVVAKKGVFGVQTSIERPTVSAPTLEQMREWYVDAATNDIIRDGKIWALPLAMDTVAAYVNKDLLNNAKIFAPAKTWTEVVNHIAQNTLTVIDESGTIVQSGLALGAADNVPYSTDILTLLMMQNGATMIDPATKKVRFNEAPGQQALEFIKGFTDPKKTAYSWNATMPNARDSFLKGKVAYYLGTYADRAAIAASSLNWTVVPMFHLDTRGDKDGATGAQRFIDVPLYSVGMVSRAAQTGRRSTTAWSLLRYFANSNNVPAYLKSTDQLSALKSVLATQKNDAGKTVFANQLLTARGWYTGRDAVRTEEYLQQLITSVVEKGDPLKPALDLAARQVETTL